MHCEAAPTSTVDGLQVTATEVMVGEVNCTATEAVPDLVVSCVLVAVTVIRPAVAGAVKSPLVLIVPPLADHFTAELKFPVPPTEALHCEIAFAATEEGTHAADTETIDDEIGDPWLPPPPPQAAIVPRITHTKSAYKR